MDVKELRKRHQDLLLELVKQPNYPSIAIMQRVEAGIREPEAALEYIEFLIEKVEQDQYPSLTMLDRISWLLRQLEAQAA